MSDFKAKCIKFDFRWGSAPDPAGGAYTAPQTSWLYLWEPTREREGKEKRKERRERGREKKRREGGERPYAIFTPQHVVLSLRSWSSLMCRRQSGRAKSIFLHQEGY